MVLGRGCDLPEVFLYILMKGLILHQHPLIHQHSPAVIHCGFLAWSGGVGIGNAFLSG